MTHNQSTIIISGISLVLLIALGFIFKFHQSLQVTRQGRVTCIPTFLDGGGPYYQPNTPFRDHLAPDENKGEQLTVRGKVLGADCVTPLSNVVVDVWQANESGNYEDEWYRGRVTTEADGSYQFTTVIPKGYGAGTAYRPPHIHFKIWNADSLLITSQMFLPASQEQGIEEAYIVDLAKNLRGTYVATHDIIVP